MHPEQPPLQSQEPHNPAIGLFRVILWLSPGPAFLLCIFGLSLISQNFMMRWIEALWIPLALVCPIIIGYCDSFLSQKIPRKDGIPLTEPAIRHVIIFTLLQILLAPCVLFAILLGFCTFAT